MTARRGTRTATIAIAVLAVLAGASPARAADVQMSTSGLVDYMPSSSYVVFRGAPGEDNAVTITREDRTFVIADSGAPLRSPDGSCEISADAGSARCTVPERLTGIDLELRDGNDRVTNEVAPGGPESFDAPDFGYELDGGPGDDVLTGSEVGDDMAGGAGNDRLNGRGGPDRVNDDALDDAHGVNSGGTDVMSGGEGDDSLSGSADDTVDGGPGADGLGLGGGTISAFGGDGDDRFFAGAGGSQTIAGEGGNDTVVRLANHRDPEPSSVAIDGGPGRDLVTYDFWDGGKWDKPTADDVGATVRLPSTQPTSGNGLPGQSDSLTGIEDAGGGRGRDVLTGSEDANRLLGGGGDDSITGGAGSDVLEGGAGGDAIDAADGTTDTVACADGPYRDAEDSMRGDSVDSVSRCSDAPDTTSPDLSGTRVPRTITFGRLRSRGLTVRLRSGDGAVNRATAVLSTRGGRRLVRRARAFTGEATLRVRPPRGKVRRRGSLRLVLTVSDAAGNVTRLRRTVRVR